jgi:hypothetical protein
LNAGGGPHGAGSGPFQTGADGGSPAPRRWPVTPRRVHPTAVPIIAVDGVYAPGAVMSRRR